MHEARFIDTKQEVSPSSKRERLRSVPVLAAFVLGGSAFWLITGGTIIRPTNVDWVLTGDPSMNYLGWMFFRNAPLFQQPFGAIWQYGVEISGSTVYSDSLSILAFPFKIVSPWLPGEFQYFGLWTSVCFLLQAFFGWKLLERLAGTKDNLWARTFATAFFVLAPAFVWRMHWHFALASHWLLLAALYLYFDQRFRLLPWIALLVVASLVTPILLTMVIMIFGASLASHYFGRELSLAAAAKSLVTAIPILLFVMWEAGYFIITDTGAAGFGVYRTSLTGFVDPAIGPAGATTNWSHLFRGQPQAPGNYEGFCFLGIGVILLAVVACAEALRRRFRPFSWRRHWALAIVFLFCLFFAWSNNVAIGPIVLFHYDIPFILEKLIAPFRASGRFIWAPYYLIITGVLVFVLKRFSRIAAVVLLGFCLIIQILDSWQAFYENRAEYERAFQPSLLNSDFWQKAGKQYHRITYVLPRETSTGFLPLCYFAASHNMPVNLCHYGRVNQNTMVSTRAQAFERLQRGILDRDALYVFETPALWRIGILHMQPGDYAAVVNDLEIIAPAWGRATQQDTAPLLKTVLPFYKLGSSLRFGTNREGSKYLLCGWSAPEPGIVWSDADRASIALPLAEKPATDVILEIDATSYVHPRWRQQKVEVFVSSVKVGVLFYTVENDQGLRTVRIPRELLADHENVEIQFRLPDAISPAEIGTLLDPRDLGVALQAVTLRAAENAEISK